MLALASIAGCGDDGESSQADAVAQIKDATHEKLMSACKAEAQTLAVAAEAHFAMFSEFPADQQALVQDGLLREPIADFELVVNADGYEVVQSNNVCDGWETAPDYEPETTEWNDSESSCESERRTVEVAREAYLAEYGVDPTSEADLVSAGLLRSESAGYDLRDGEIVPTGCS